MSDAGNDGVGAVAWRTTNVNDAEGAEACEATVCDNTTELSAINASFSFGRDRSCFMRRKFDSYNVMVKLVDSLPEAAKPQADLPERYKVGLHGWTTLVFPHSEARRASLRSDR